MKDEGTPLLRALAPLMLLGCLVCCGCSKQKTTDELLSDLHSPVERDRIVAVRLLQGRKGESAQVVPALIESLKDKQDEVRCSAAIGLGYFGEQAKDAVPALEAVQRDRDPRVREAATVALSRIDPTRFANTAKGKPAPK